MTKTILGIFQDRTDVERAIDKFESEGFKPADFSIVMKDKHEAEDLGNDTGANVAGGAVSGAASGAVLGGLAGLIAGIAIPGVGAFLIGGPIAAALGLTGAAASTVSGAATGAVVGGIAGALMGMGLSREDAEYYEGKVKEGAILLAVPTRENQQELVMSIFDDCNASDVKTISQDDAAGRTQQHTSHQADHRQYAHAHMGTKGGKVGNSKTHKGRGWHGESKEHAAAAKGKTATKRGKTK
jgi:hypothetical protein